MKVTFPHMGNTYIIIKALFDELDIEYIIPPENSKKTLEIGTRYAPEMACLPLKINLGNFIEAYELGADTIVITGGCGPCRFGYYSQLQKEILNDNGYNFDIIPLELPDNGPKEFVERLKKLTGGLRPVKIINGVRKAVKVAQAVDELEKLTFYTRPREAKKGETNRIYKDFLKAVKEVNGVREILKLISDTRTQLLSMRLDRECRPLKIGIVGEIYTLIDPYSNQGIEQKLGAMGVEVDRSLMLGGWIVEHLIKTILHLKKDLEHKEAAKSYLNAMIGGHAQETVGNAVLYARKNYDGLIQLYPLTCMPEIVAESILPSIEEDYNIPVLTLIIDEMTGEAGYLTRIEAFVDLLQRRKETENNKHELILSGN